MPDPTHSYRSRLSPWCIVYHLPKMQRQIIARHRKRTDAEDHLRLLRQLSPSQTYELMFDPPLPERLLTDPDPTLHPNQTAQNPVSLLLAEDSS